MKNLILVLSAVLFTSCQSAKTKSDAPPVKKATEANLTQVEAKARAQAVRNVKYDLTTTIDANRDDFTATAKINFITAEPPEGLFLDLRDGAKISSMTINGKSVAAQFAHHRVQLPKEALVNGSNSVTINYQQDFSHEGRGLHRFVDPEDKRVYLYSQFEAFDAHQMFPCFDQPDLKATMTMNITVPKDWEVITTVRETTKQEKGEMTQWTFPETPKISTYLFSLHAGPYTKWEAKAGTIPLRLFARQSMAKFVVLKDWIVPTQQGLKFYGKYFDYPYPFKKYDQIIAPEFNAGAMENVAAVTFSEHYVRRSTPTYKEREYLASVILHEMAHMWFGDLVTMQWWNNLWLNETFATYMSSLSMFEATEFHDSWISFYSFGKTRAYIEDQLVTTHPIEADIPDTNSAFSNFDSITYAKGASVMKQLSFYLGADKFRDGVRYYFKRHAYQNTNLEDFMAALEHSSGKDLKGWSHAWLETAGVDTLEADYTCADGKVNAFALSLNGPDGKPSPRVHRTLVSLYQEINGKVLPLKSASVIYQGSRTEVPQLKGAKCPVMVYPNELDHDYAKVRLDTRTLDFAKDNLTKIASTFTRVMFWPNLFSMVRDVELTPQDFIRIVEKNLPSEQDLTIGDTILSPLTTMLYYLPQTTASEKAQRLTQVQILERLLWDKLNQAKPGSDWQKMALGSLTDIAETSEARDRLVGLLDGTIAKKGLTIDMDRRWQMLIRLSSLGDPRAVALLAKQREEDKSSRGIENGYAAEAAQPSLDVKNEWWSKIVDHDEMSFSQKGQVLYNLFPRLQTDLRSALSERFYKTLPELTKSREMHFLQLYTRALVPAVCRPESAAKLGSFMAENAGTLPAPVIKSLRISRQEDSRCVAIRARATR